MSNGILGDQIKKIHFTGIGGISMSGLAEILMNQGYQITGSDMYSSPITEKLKQKGIDISYEHSKDNIKDQDLIVYTAAVKDSNPELSTAKEKGIKLIDRATLLGKIMQSYKTRIAVSGTHGKTTTTSMISSVMLEAKLNPTIHLGGILDIINGGTFVGSQNYFITEACEYVESFLKFYPNMAVLLNIEPDHLDYFKDLNHIKQSFSKFASHVPTDGTLIVNMDDKNAMGVAHDSNCQTVTYGLNSVDANWTARNIVFDETGNASFIIVHDKKALMKFKLGVPGIHNVSNALACIALSFNLGVALEDIGEGLRKFTGTHRRFELKGVINNIKVVDDYAHHPTEVKATLKASRNCTHGRIFCVFQPHTYTRTKALLDDFSKAFTLADQVIVTDIYAAREQDTGMIHSVTLTDKINENYKNATYISDFKDIIAHLEQSTKPGDLIITMGAGNINKVGEMFLSEKKVKAVG